MAMRRLSGWIVERSATASLTSSLTAISRTISSVRIMVKVEKNSVVSTMTVWNAM